MPLSNEEKAEQARCAAKLSPTHWDIFVRLTTEEAKNLRKDDPNKTWKDVDKGQREKALENINSKLVEKDIPTVNLEVVAWRISRALRRLKHEGTYSHSPR
ncbi:uncharacterized protein ALTATR162_LOCUS12124 [Alternaria atra]|uniref:Uncharacterized protein n=1 Tax=Alternaria atra TaxID=119953 RepID=A0A8J2N670_9PLEO|nr:uncharacterized protein ALTATR162_LOCUS12124 [Alternaria atra]CAG5190079.1 unnamed protein product [Alternaria atra]